VSSPALLWDGPEQVGWVLAWLLHLGRVGLCAGADRARVRLGFALELKIVPESKQFHTANSKIFLKMLHGIAQLSLFLVSACLCILCC